MKTGRAAESRITIANLPEDMIRLTLSLSPTFQRNPLKERAETGAQLASFYGNYFNNELAPPLIYVQISRTWNRLSWKYLNKYRPIDTINVFVFDQNIKIIGHSTLYVQHRLCIDVNFYERHFDHFRAENWKNQYLISKGIISATAPDLEIVDDNSSLKSVLAACSRVNTITVVGTNATALKFLHECLGEKRYRQYGAWWRSSKHMVEVLEMHGMKINLKSQSVTFITSTDSHQHRPTVPPPTRNSCAIL